MTTQLKVAALRIGVMAVAVGAMALAAPEASAGPILEDDLGWNCAEMGNRVCGPNNDTGLVSGCYNDRGEIVAVWPCHIVVNADGSADVYEG